jgi:hypothetical protein
MGSGMLVVDALRKRATACIAGLSESNENELDVAARNDSGSGSGAGAAPTSARLLDRRNRVGEAMPYVGLDITPCEVPRPRTSVLSPGWRACSCQL